MRSTNGVEDSTTRKARLRRIGRFLTRPVSSAIGRARMRVRRRDAVARPYSASAEVTPSVAPVSIDDERAPLIDVSKGLEEFTNAIGSFLSTTVGIALDAQNQGFPSQVTPFRECARYSAAENQQSLTAIGSKQWGSWWDGRGLLRVKIYDFALYTNPRQLTALAPTLARRLKSDGQPNPLSPASTLPGLAPLSPPSNVSSLSSPSTQVLQISRSQPSNTSGNQISTPLSLQSAETVTAVNNEGLVSGSELESTRRPLRHRLRPRLPLRRRNRGSKSSRSGAITDRVRAAANEVEMSLCVRPARDLPLMMLRSEYSRILRKRLKMVGGNAEDAALHTLLSYFNPAKLPEGSTRRGCIRKGTNMIFSRSKSGSLTTTADGALVATVQSPKLCEAVFDLYLGAQPVCKKARETAKEKYEDIVASSKPLGRKGLSLKGLSIAI